MLINRYQIITALGDKYGAYISNLLYRKVGGSMKQIVCNNGGNKYGSFDSTIRMLVHYDLDSSIKVMEKSMNKTYSEKYKANYAKVIKTLNKLKEIHEVKQ